MDKQKIDRINFLAKKAKNEGLTPEETEERARLREEYLANFRAGFRAQLDNIVIVDEEGNRKELRKNKPN